MEQRRETLAELAAAAIGIVAFFAFAGWWVLIPGNLSWLGYADRAMHTLGWMFYRDGPWSWPPGASPTLGRELANSIALVDALPLVAVPLKLFAQWLPRPFQYWGYWWLSCFILQGLFAYRLARALEGSQIAALGAAAFAVMTPAFLFRLDLHMALAGHFLVIAALWLYAKPATPRPWAWPLLMAVTSATHIYLVAMVGTIWAAALAERLLTGRASRVAIVVEAVAAPAAGLLVLYLGGAFIGMGSGRVDGFGAFRLNLFSPIIDYGIWSRLFPTIPHDTYDYEGIGFLGIGVLVLLALAVLTRATAPVNAAFSRRWAPLTLVVLLMFVAALSNRIGFANYAFAPYPVPGPLQAVADMFRSSGRFVWPLLYLGTVGIVVLISRRFAPRLAVPLILASVALQAVDSEPGWSQFRDTIPAPAESWPTVYRSPFWERAGTADFNIIRSLPMRYRAPDWLAIETFAHRYGFTTDAIYLGRVDERVLFAQMAADAAMVAAGTFDPRTIYVLNLAMAKAVAPNVQPGDLFAIVDGRIVFARGGAYLLEGLGIDPEGARNARSWMPPDISRSAGFPF